MILNKVSHINIDFHDCESFYHLMSQNSKRPSENLFQTAFIQFYFIVFSMLWLSLRQSRHPRPSA